FAGGLGRGGPRGSGHAKKKCKKASESVTGVTLLVSRNPPAPYFAAVMHPALPVLISVLSQFPDTGWTENARPCLDTLHETQGDWGRRDRVTGDFGGAVEVEDCD